MSNDINSYRAHDPEVWNREKPQRDAAFIRFGEEQMRLQALMRADMARKVKYGH